MAWSEKLLDVASRRRLLAGVLVLVLAGAAAAGCGHARPSRDEAARGIEDFAGAIRFAATRPDARLARILEASASGSPRGSAAGGMVHQSGTRIVDGAGRSLALKGVNLGGALLWEAWIWGGELSLLKMRNQSESHIRSALADLVGPGAVRALSDRVYDDLASEADFEAIAAHGFNVVRVPFNHRLLEAAPSAPNEAGFRVLDRIVDGAEASGVYVVLDLHGAPGGQSKHFIADPDATLLWASEDAKRRTVALWQAIAARYRDRAIVAGYDLLNEPDPPSGAALVDLYRRIVAAIRAVDDRHLIVLEGASSAQDFSMFSGPLDRNQAYSFHLYTWFGQDAHKLTAGYARVARRDSVPMWCGEFGENDHEAIRKTVGVFDQPDLGIVGWAFWTWKKAANRYPALHEIRVTPAWKSTISWVADP